MRILYVSQYFPPEMGAPAARVSELAVHWAASGHEVTVLTGFPNHPTGEVHPDYRSRFRRLTTTETYKGVKVVRSWLLPLPNRRPIERILNYVSFMLSAAVRGSFLRRPDVIIASSPQLLVGIAGWWLHLVRRAPLVVEIRDIWPDAIVASGVTKTDSLLARGLRAISRFLHARARAVVVVSPAYVAELIEGWHVPAAKIAVVRNGVDVDLFRPLDGSEPKRDLGVEGKFVVSYVGTVGFAHGLGTILDCAARLRERAPEVLLVVIGAGADTERLGADLQRRALDNVLFLGERPRPEIPSLIAASDVGLVLLKRHEVFRTVIPTKMLEIMACARPVILGVEGVAKEILSAADAGIPIAPEDVDELVSAILRLRDDPAARDEMGSSGRRYVERNLTRETTAAAYIKVLERVVRRLPVGA